MPLPSLRLSPQFPKLAYEQDGPLPLIVQKGMLENERQSYRESCDSSHKPGRRDQTVDRSSSAQLGSRSAFHSAPLLSLSSGHTFNLWKQERACPSDAPPSHSTSRVPITPAVSCSVTAASSFRCAKSHSANKLPGVVHWQPDPRTRCVGQV